MNKSQNLVKNISSLRDSAKQNRGNPKDLRALALQPSADLKNTKFTRWITTRNKLRS